MAMSIYSYTFKSVNQTFLECQNDPKSHLLEDLKVNSW